MWRRYRESRLARRKNEAESGKSLSRRVRQSGILMPRYPPSRTRRSTRSRRESLSPTPRTMEFLSSNGTWHRAFRFGLPANLSTALRVCFSGAGAGVSELTKSSKSPPTGWIHINFLEEPFICLFKSRYSFIEHAVYRSYRGLIE